MAEASQYGRGLKAVVLNQQIPSTDQTTHTSLVTTLSGPSAVSYVLATKGNARILEMSAGDTATASSHTLVVALGNFTADDVGASVLIAGSQHNNGTTTIASVTNGTTVVMSSGLADETFVGTESALLTQTNTLDGSWAILVSNDNDAQLDQRSANSAATWPDITSAFSPSIATVAHGTASTLTQVADMTVTGLGAVKVTFTASAGHGTAFAAIKGGAY